MAVKKGGAERGLRRCEWLKTLYTNAWITLVNRSNQAVDYKTTRNYKVYKELEENPTKTTRKT